jgi:molecular chaperone GrpE
VTEKKEAEVAEEATALEAVAPPPPTQAEYESLKAERDELKDQLLRRRADFENYRKRVERDRNQASRDAVFDALRSILPTLDNLERALAHADEGHSLKEGVELIQRELLVTLENLGLRAHDPVGERYDPELHEALSVERVPGAEDGKIVEVLRKAYYFKDRLLRPALVRVSRSGDGEVVQ